MLGIRKRIFAGKQAVHSEPFCPYITDDRGYSSLRHKHNYAPKQPAAPTVLYTYDQRTMQLR